MFKQTIAALILSTVGVSAAEYTKTTLEDYAFDFTSIGYEIEVSGKTSIFSTSADQWIWLRDTGRKVKVNFSTLSRNGRKQVIDHMNSSCKGFGVTCPVTVKGEVEFDEDMQMQIKAFEMSLSSKAID